MITNIFLIIELFIIVILALFCWNIMRRLIIVETIIDIFRKDFKTQYEINATVAKAIGILEGGEQNE